MRLSTLYEDRSNDERFFKALMKFALCLEEGYNITELYDMLLTNTAQYASFKRIANDPRAEAIVNRLTAAAVPEAEFEGILLDNGITRIGKRGEIVDYSHSGIHELPNAHNFHKRDPNISDEACNEVILTTLAGTPQKVKIKIPGFKHKTGVIPALVYPI